MRRLMYVQFVFVIILLTIAGTNVDGVRAFQVTSTNTRDYRTPPNTPNATEMPILFPTEGDQNFPCPATGLPSGFGTVTPGALWNMACEHCLPSPTEWPTSMYFGSGNTPEPTNTPVVTVTGTLPTSTVTNTITSTPTSVVLCGNLATTTGTPTKTITPTATVTYNWVNNDNNVYKSYNGFGNEVYAGHYGGSSYYAQGVGSYIIFEFTGIGVRWYGQKASWQGYADIYIDNVFVERVDTYNSSSLYQQIIWSKIDLNYGLHELKIYVPHEKNGSSSGYYVYVDRWDYLTSATTPTVVPSPTLSSGHQYSASGIVVQGAGIFDAGSYISCAPMTGLTDMFQCYGYINGYKQWPGLDGNVTGALSINTFDNSVDRWYWYMTIGSVSGISGTSQFCRVEGVAYIACTSYMDVLQDYADFEVGLRTSTTQTGYFSTTFQMVVSANPFYCATATEVGATNTPEAATWCYVISDSPYGDITDIDFWTRTGVSQCTTINSFEVDNQTWFGALVSTVLSWFGWDLDFTPAITFCLDVYDFEEFSLFGVNINFAWLFDILIVLAIIYRLQLR